jgi:hypothetical protein
MGALGWALRLKLESLGLLPEMCGCQDLSERLSVGVSPGPGGQKLYCQETFFFLSSALQSPLTEVLYFYFYFLLPDASFAQNISGQVYHFLAANPPIIFIYIFTPDLGTNGGFSKEEA